MPTLQDSVAVTDDVGNTYNYINSGFAQPNPNRSMTGARYDVYWCQSIADIPSHLYASRYHYNGTLIDVPHFKPWAWAYRFRNHTGDPFTDRQTPDLVVSGSFYQVAHDSDKVGDGDNITCTFTNANGRIFAGCVAGIDPLDSDPETRTFKRLDTTNLVNFVGTSNTGSNIALSAVNTNALTSGAHTVNIGFQNFEDDGVTPKFNLWKTAYCFGMEAVSGHTLSSQVLGFAKVGTPNDDEGIYVDYADYSSIIGGGVEFLADLQIGDGLLVFSCVQEWITLPNTVTLSMVI